MTTDLIAAPTLLVALPPRPALYPAFELASLSENLRGGGFDSVIHDLNIELFHLASPQQADLWGPGYSAAQLTEHFAGGAFSEELTTFVEWLAEAPTQVVALLVPERGEGVAAHLSRMIKGPRPDLYLVGLGPRIWQPEVQQTLFEAGVDYLVPEELEATLPELLSFLLDGVDALQVPGAMAAPHRNPVPFAPRAPLDLRELLLPSFSGVRFHRYPLAPGGRMVALRSSRGCEEACVCCPGPCYPGARSTVDPEALITQLDHLAVDHGVEQVTFTDRLLNGDPEHLRRWCEGLVQAGLGLRWSGALAIRPEMDAELLALMRRAGCVLARFELLSGSDRLLAAMEAPHDTDLAHRVLEAAHGVGLHTAVELMVGLPGETEADLQLTTAFLTSHRPLINEVSRLSACALEPGSRLTEQPELYGVRRTGPGPTDFCDAEGVDAAVRQERLLMLVGVLAEQGIPFGEVVDQEARVGRVNAEVERRREALLAARRAEHTLSTDAIAAELDDVTRAVRLTSLGHTLLRDPGLWVRLSLEDRVVEMGCGRWSAWRADDGVVHLESALLGHPMRLHLAVSRPTADGLQLTLDLLVEEEARLRRVGVGFALPPALERYLTLATRGDLTLPEDPLLDSVVICSAPANFVILASEPGADDPLALSVQLTDHLYWECRLERHEEQGRRVVFQRALAADAGGHPMHEGRHRLFAARVDAMPPAAVEAFDEGESSATPLDDFALVFCPPGQNRTAPVWPAIIAGALRAKGLSGLCHDVNTMVVRNTDPALHGEWQRNRRMRWQLGEPFEALWPEIAGAMDRARREVVALRPRTVIFYTTPNNLRCSVRLAEMIKEVLPEAKVIFCGSGVYWTTEVDGGQAPLGIFDPETQEHLDPNGAVDLYLRGEPDLAMPQLLHHIDRGLSLLSIPGVTALRRGTWRSPHPPILPATLDKLPMADFADFAVAAFASQEVPLLSSRGCQRSCAFCNACRMQAPYRNRSAERLVKEMLRLHRRFGMEGFVFEDLMLNGDLEQLERMCDLLLDSGVPLRWRGRMAVSEGLNHSLVEKMAWAGCRELRLSVDSLAQPVVDAMRKGFPVQVALDLLRDAHEAGIDTALELMVGFPRETPELFQQTAETVQQQRELITRVERLQICRLAYGSRLWESPELFGVETAEREHFWHLWEGPSGNTFEERQRRLWQLYALCDDLELSPPEPHDPARAPETLPLLLIED